LKKLIVLLSFLVASCNNLTAKELPTPTSNPVQEVIVKDNFLLELDEKNFISSLEYVINELMLRDPELGQVLLGCDIAISYSPTAEDVSIIGNSANGLSNCAITLIRQVDYSTPDSIWSEYNPNQPNGRSIVAAVIPIGESNFPLMVIPEGVLDAEYFIRVMGHEAFHMLRFLKGENCPAGADKSCEINEEVLAFNRQFELLDYYLIKTGQVQTYKERGLTFLPGTSELNQTAVKLEYALYFLNKEGLLYQYLYEQNYGEGFK